jgi:inhibitor of KinA sporulation pathway (predicted exonuclease)
MKTLKYDKVVVIDVESTCDDRDPTFRDRSEIIEIGAVLAKLSTGEILQCDSFLIKPTRTPITPFCTRLTTISQPLIDLHGTSWSEAVSKMLALGYAKHPWMSWGDYDRHMIQRMIEQHHTVSPVSYRHINLKLAYTLKHRLTAEPGVARALNRHRLTFAGTQHRGVDDAINIWELAKTVFEPAQPN